MKKRRSLIQHMDPERAVQAAVLDYGVVEFCKDTGLDPRYVRNKLNPSQERHTLSLHMAVEWTLHVGNPLPVEAWAHLMGGVYIQLPTEEDVSDAQLFHVYSELMKEVGALSGAFYEDMQDGQISTTELQRLEKLINDCAAAGERFRQRLRAKAGRKS